LSGLIRHVKKPYVKERRKLRTFISAISPMVKALLTIASRSFRIITSSFVDDAKEPRGNPLGAIKRSKRGTYCHFLVQDHYRYE